MGRLVSMLHGLVVGKPGVVIVVGGACPSYIILCTVAIKRDLLPESDNTILICLAYFYTMASTSADCLKPYRSVF